MKRFTWQQDYASKDTFFVIGFVVQNKLGLNIRDQKEKNVTEGGGGRKVKKNCLLLLFKWPHIESLQAILRQCKVKLIL